VLGQGVVLQKAGVRPVCADPLEAGQAIAAARQKAVGDQMVGGGHVQRRAGDAGTQQGQRGHAAALGPHGVDNIAEPARVEDHELAHVAVLRRARGKPELHGVFQHGLELRAGDVHLHQGVAKGQHAQHLPLGDRPGEQILADAARAHKGKLRARNLGQIGIGHQRAGVGGRAPDEVRADAHAQGRVLEGRNLLRIRRKLGQQGRVVRDHAGRAAGLHRRAQGLALGRGRVHRLAVQAKALAHKQPGRRRVPGNAPGGVKVHRKLAQHLAPLPGLDHKHGRALRAGRQRGIRPSRVQAEVGQGGAVAQQGVRVPAHDDVQAGHGARQLLVHVIAVVRKQDDLVHPFRLQLAHQRADDRRGVQKAHAAHIAGYQGRCRRGGPDDGHDLAALCRGEAPDDIRAQAVGQGGLGAGVHVGGQHREARQGQHSAKLRRAFVELVVAQAHGVQAQLIQKVELRRALEHGEIERALHRVPGVQGQHARFARARGVQGGLEPGHAAKRGAHLL